MKSVFLAAAIATVMAAPLAAQAPTDPQIAGIVVASNDVDIAAARLALRRTSNAEVKAFARDMIRDHSAVTASAVKLVTRLHVTPAASPTATKLRTDGAATLASLKAAARPRFKGAYIDSEVTYHQAILDAIDNTLIPSAQNADLKALLVKTRPVVAEHLAHARRIQAAMKG